MGRKNTSENSSYKNYLAELKRELSGIKLPAILLVITLVAAIGLPYAGEKISQFTSLYTLQMPLHECVFVELSQPDLQKKIETIVTKNLKDFSLLSGTEKLGTALLEEIPNIASIKCSLDRDHTIRLVITGNKTASTRQNMSEEDRGLNVMQVQQHQPSHYIANNQLHDATFGTQRATTFEGAFEVLLSTTDALLAKPQRLPATFHAIAQPNLTQQPQPINIATNDFKNNQPIHSHKEEPSLSCKGNQL